MNRPVDADRLRAALRAARQQHRAGAGAVLDVVLRSLSAQATDIADLMASVGGVRVLDQADGWHPEFSQWTQQDAVQGRCVVLCDGNGTLLIAAEDPWDDDEVQKVSRRIEQLPPLAAVPGRLMAQWLTGTERTGGSDKPRPDDASAADGPIVAFVDDAIRAAFAAGASDVHFECDRRGVTVKQRLDGVMARFARMDDPMRAQEVISRIKVLAQLDITERRLPQDGRFRFERGDESIDLRVSIMPSIHGEDAVLRLLDKAQLRRQRAEIDLAALGFETVAAQQIRDLAERPNGMLLVTGPTGSGKTTTVYAVLSEINTGIEKIITIEDPVEYELPGVLQIPVNERKGLTFAKGLRSILRHDPDRILVGEIRDAETAEIAVQSALTGHLVFTTVHANSMADIMGRFRHFGLDMFGFMSSLNGVVVQRLVRRLCPSCQAERAPSVAEQAWLARAGQPDACAVPRAAGCGACQGSGYAGRFVLAEVHEVDDALRDAVIQGAPVSVLKRHAEDQGVVSLARRAARHVLEGRTTLEEVKRVVGWA